MPLYSRTRVDLESSRIRARALAQRSADLRTTAHAATFTQAVARSPLYASFSEVLAGLITVRAFGEQERFQAEQLRALNAHIQPYFLVRTALMAYLTVRINCFSSIILGTIGALALWGGDILTPGLLGVTMTYALIVDNFLRMIVFITTELEVQMNSVERIKYYGEQIPSEQAHVIEDTAPDPAWPQEASVLC